jgi:formylglycine-generating enzyme required for sulfatase activity
MRRRQKPIFSVLDGIKIGLVEGSRKPPRADQAPKLHGDEGALLEPALENETFRADAVSGREVEELGPGDQVGLARSLGVIKLSADSYDFGLVAMSHNEDWVVTVHNEGDGELTIEGLDGLPSQGFRLVDQTGLPFAVPPHGSVDLKVRFAPNSTGKKGASLRIVAQGANSTATEIRLAGTAVEVILTAAGEYYSPIINSLGMSLVYVPQGSFIMGSPEDEQGRNEDEVQHKVTITKALYIQNTPVTQGQWKALMGNDPSALGDRGDHFPIEQVSWSDCQEFIKRMNALGEGTYRLPTEAEWEYACRAGSTAAFALGDLTTFFCDHDPILDELGWYCGNSERHTHTVAQKSPNAYGLCDMHGNVCEWCQDWYGVYSIGPEEDPTGPGSGSKRVIRGGSWFSSAKTCRSASRFSWASKQKTPFIGFRLVRELYDERQLNLPSLSGKILS